MIYLVLFEYRIIFVLLFYLTAVEEEKMQGKKWITENSCSFWIKC